MNTPRRINLDHLQQVQNTHIGFNELFDSLLGSSEMWRPNSNYPPYDIIETTTPLDKDVGQKTFQIHIALAGFKREDFEIQVKRSENSSTLEVKSIFDSTLKDGNTYIHKGISKKSFFKTFTLNPNVDVIGAVFEDGLLRIEMISRSIKPDIQKIQIK